MATEQSQKECEKQSDIWVNVRGPLSLYFVQFVISRFAEAHKSMGLVYKAFYIIVGQNKASSLRQTHSLTMSATEGASGVQISVSSFQTLSATVSDSASFDTLSNLSQWFVSA